MNHIADNQDALLDYLYEEGDPAERLAIAKHLQECAPCSVAVLEFQSVRGMLSDWTPPDAQLGFRVVQDPSLSAPVNHGARSGWWRGWGPATHQEKWGPATTNKSWRPALQAAAAVLIFAAGMAVSQLDVDYQDGALTVRTQSAAPAMPVANMRNASIVLPAERVPLNAQAGTAAPVDLDQIERELRDRLELRDPSPTDTERLLQRVRAMIDQSEQRQEARTRQELALRLSQIVREVDTQHQADMLRVQQEFGQQQEATMEYLVRTSGGTK
jgi:hypothetical protein